MNRRRSRNRTFFRLLVLLILLLAGLVGAEVYFPGYFARNMQAGGAIAPDSAGQASAPGQQDGPAIPGERAFAVIALRPLFSTTRRPSEQPAAPGVAPVAGNLGLFVVSGIVTSGEDTSAILEFTRAGPQQEKGLVVRPGDTVQGWTVEAIGDGRVTFAKGADRQSLELKPEEPRKPGVIPRRPAPGAPPAPRRPVQPPTPRQQPIPPPK